ncbi:MAG: hypothetical protein Q9170_006874 [Blastenia crenularia]
MFAAEPPPPPPPPYGGARTMLPPTSPQNLQPQYNGGHSTLSRPNIPLPPSFSGARDLPALPTSRPESSMSISSMLGSDVGEVAKDRSMTTQRNGSGTSTKGSFSSPTHTTKTMSSPTRRVIGQNLFRKRSPSPIDRERVHGVINRPFRAFSNDVQRHAPRHPGPTSPKAPTFRSSLGQNITQRSPKSEQSPTQQWRFSHHRQSSGSKTGKRPSSQPSGHGTPPHVVEPYGQLRSAISTSDRDHELQVTQKYNRLGQEAKQRSNYGPAERPSQEFLEEHIRRVREERAAQAAANHISPKTNTRPQTGARPSVSTTFPSNRFRSEIENVDHVYNHDPPDMPTTIQSPFSPDYLRRSREERLAVNEPQPPSLSQSDSTQSRYSDRTEERHRQQFLPIQQTSAPSLDRSVSTNGIDQVSKLGDEHIIQQPRHSLSLLIESGKRGRVSPLPQAVQGAQGRNCGPASDPGIKNEFGRMFSGIGSGVGSSGPMGSGNSTPFPASPKINNYLERRTPFASRGELGEVVRPRARSKLGKRGLSKDDSSRAESEARAFNSTVMPSARGAKKTYTHRHHPHNHRIHHLPRHHLGSTLYAPVLEPASVTAAQHHTTKLGVSSIPKPLPRFEGKANCLFTVRVPRFYLSDLEREEVTRRRALWGCDVYTDDSDPLAAAIHAGWVQGSWGEDMDVSMLEPFNASSQSIGKPAVIDLETSETGPAISSGSTATLASPPPEPMIPPKNRDLHLTCLVLPPLERYTSKICHGIESRGWGDNHDGMSFRIERIEWVDEGVGKGEERTGEARRKRMRGLLEEGKGYGKGFVSPVVRIGGELGGMRKDGHDTVMVGA